MPLERFNILLSFEETFKLWSRKLGVIQENLTKLAKSGEMYVTTSTDSNSVSLNGGLVICDSTSALVVTLPEGSNRVGITYDITNINTGTVTVTPASTNETIHGDETFDLYQDENLQITTNGSNWYLS
jgi:hypothetical protein